MMQGETSSPCAFDSLIQPSAPTFGGSSAAGAALLTLVEDDVIEVIVSDALGERQGRRELHLYLETWRASHPGLKLELLD